MGYYMRYILTDDRETTLSEIETGLKQVDPDYSIGDGETLMYGDELYGEIEINVPGDGLFEAEVEELKEEIKDNRGRNKTTVLEALQKARAIVAVRVLWQDRETEQTLDKIDPLWEWLFDNREGLLQADGEGYYSQSKHILKVA